MRAKQSRNMEYPKESALLPYGLPNAIPGMLADSTQYANRKESVAFLWTKKAFWPLFSLFSF
jgi:hypothetical protein